MKTKMEYHFPVGMKEEIKKHGQVGIKGICPTGKHKCGIKGWGFMGERWMKLVCKIIEEIRCQKKTNINLMKQ